MYRKISFLTVFLLFCIFSIYADEYISVKPSEISVKPAAKVPFMVALFKNGKVQTQILPWDFKFHAQKGKFSGSVYTAPQTPGTYIIWVSYKKTKGLAMVTVKGDEDIASLQVIPSQVKLYKGETFRFKVKAVGKSGNVINFAPAWGSKGGKIHQDGNFTAGEKTGKFTIVAWGPGGLKTSAIVHIKEKIIKKPASKLTHFSITPRSAKLDQGKQFQFSVIALDQYRKKLKPTIKWSASGGKINQQGLFTAGKKPGMFWVQARAKNKQAKVQIEVKKMPPFLHTIKMVTKKVNLKPGNHFHFKAHAYDQFGKKMDVPFSWSASGGQINQQGIFTAGKKPGNYKVWVRSGKIDAESYVQIEQEPPFLKYIKVTPKEITLKPGDSIQFQAYATDQYNKKMLITYRWNASGGEINQQGVFRAGSIKGKYKITVYANGKKAISYVTIKEQAPVVTRILIIPRAAKIKPGKTVQFKGYSFNAQGKKIRASLSWSASGGKIDQTGMFTAGKNAGIFQVMVKHKQVQSIAKIEIEKPRATIKKLVIFPKKNVVKIGERITFQAYSIDQYGKKKKASVAWFASGGKIDAFGNFRAGNKQETITIVALSRKANIKAKTTVSVTAPTFTYHIEVTPKKITVNPKQKIRYKVALFRNGKEEWSWGRDFTFFSPEGSFDDMVYTAPSKPGTYKIKVRHYRGTTEVMVTVKAPKIPKGNPVSDILITPGEIRLTSGYSKKIKAVAVDKFGEALDRKLKWYVQGGKLQGDEFTAGSQSGVFTIKVEDPKSKISKTIRVIITKVEPRYQIKVKPRTLVLLPGEEKTIDIKLFQGGKEKWTWAWEYNITTTGGSFSSGIYKAPLQPGKYTIMIKHNKATLMYPVTVKKLDTEPQKKISPKKNERIPHKAYVLKVTPGDTSVMPGERVPLKPCIYFNGKRRWSWAWEFRYNTSGGIMSGDDGNIWIAPNTPGKYKIHVIHRDAKATITITVKGKMKIYIIPSKANLYPGQEYFFLAKVYSYGGKLIKRKIIWSTNGGSIDQDGRFVAHKKTGNFYVWAQDSKQKDVYTAARITIKEKSSMSYFHDGYRWGYGIKNATKTRGLLLQYMAEDLFFDNHVNTYQFLLGFGVGYGKNGSNIIKNIWRKVILNYGKFYGSGVKKGSITQKNAATFMRKYINRLTRPEQNAFKRGFLNVFSYPRGQIIYSRVWRRSLD